MRDGVRIRPEDEPPPADHRSTNAAMADRAAPDGGDLGGGSAFAAGLDGARAGAFGGGGGELSNRTSVGGGTSGRQVALAPRLLGGNEPARGPFGLPSPWDVRHVLKPG
eukprot:3770090-Prymnesium_polylepis.1